MSSLRRPTAKTATSPAELSGVLASFYDTLLPLSQDAISPDRVPALQAMGMPSLAAMRSIRGDAAGLSGPRACILVGKVSRLDGGEGIFIWDASSTTRDDDTNTIESPAVGVPPGAPGRWRRVVASLPPNVQTFGADGTWTKPTNGTPTWVRIELVPWGASGGSGSRADVTGAGVASGPGGAGGASGASVFEGPASLFGATEAVTFGSQPLGGVAPAADNTNGNAGTDAPDATFGAWLRARGGKAGGAGLVGGAAGGGGTGGYGNLGTGGAGGAGALAGGVAGSAGGGRAGGGGGGGAGLVAFAGAGTVGGVGGACGPDRATTLAGGNHGAAGSSAAAGEMAGGGGGGGGSSNSAGQGEVGGAGGSYGGGGGGGSGGINGVAGKSGGDGGPCFGRVITWF